MGISKFVDIITSYSNIGKNQQQTLKDATRKSLINEKWTISIVKGDL